MASLGPGFRWHDERDRQRFCFNEWVYCNYRSEQVNGVVQFGRAKDHPGVLSVQVYPKGGEGLVITKYLYTEDEVEASNTSFDIRIDSSKLEITDTGLKTQGEITDAQARVSWELEYLSLLPSVSSFEVPFGLLPFEHLGWKVLAPMAQVKGIVSVNGEVLNIDGFGYVDSNYGQWIPGLDPNTSWNWLTACNMDAVDPLCLFGMNIRSAPERGALYVFTKEHQYAFPVDENTFIHDRFEEATQSGFMKPIRTQVLARDEGATLEGTVTTNLDTIFRQLFPLEEFLKVNPNSSLLERLAMGLARHIPYAIDWPLIESFVSFDGTLRLSGGGVQNIKAFGMREYGLTAFMPDWLRVQINKYWLAL